MKFIVDNQLPIALSRFLEGEGLQACHVMDVQLDKGSDTSNLAIRKNA